MSEKRQQSFDALLSALQETVESHLQSINQIQGTVTSDQVQTYTASAMSQQEEQADIRNNMQVALESAQAELANVRAYEDAVIAGVQPGAFVETRDRIFFIGSSQRGIPFGKKEIVGVSLAAPAFAVMEPLQKGDAFRLGNTEYEVEDIY